MHINLGSNVYFFFIQMSQSGKKKIVFESRTRTNARYIFHFFALT